MRFLKRVVKFLSVTFPIITGLMILIGTFVTPHLAIGQVLAYSLACVFAVCLGFWAWGDWESDRLSVGKALGVVILATALGLIVLPMPMVGLANANLPGRAMGEAVQVLAANPYAIFSLVLGVIGVSLFAARSS